MSLKEAAQYIQSQGRGNDSRLMHVTPSELQGLQALAMAKGGSLTINPHTGLPEAGFLEDVLPVAAAGAAMFFAPALAPAIGGAFGASGALATGIGAGLLAGGSSLLTQALSGQPVNVGKAATTGALTGLTAGAFAPSTAVQTQVPALTAAANAPAVIPGADTLASTITTPTVTSGAQPITNTFAYNASGEMVPANYPASVTGATNLPTTPAPAADKSWWASLSPKEQLMTGIGGIGGLSLLGSLNQPKIQTPPSTSYIRPYTYSQTRNPNYGQPGQSYYNQSYTPLPTYQAAQGGLMSIGGGVVEKMSEVNAGQGTYPGAFLDHASYATPSQMPTSAEVVRSDYDVNTNPYTGDIKRMADGGITSPDYFTNLYNQQVATQPSAYIPTSQGVQDYNKILTDRAAEEYLRNPMPSAMIPASQRQAYIQQPQSGLMAASAGLPQYTYDATTRRYVPVAPQAPVEQQPVAAAPNPMDAYSGGKAGGLMPYDLGSYSDGGRLLKGPGDGMSDNIPASIGDKQPARLADGEFVVPADVVSHLGNGSTDAGAKKLYAMMDKVRTARVGTKKQGKEIKAEKYLKA